MDIPICVVGAGIIGSWTALHLAKAGVKTVLMEQFPIPHSRGSSHGQTRVFIFIGDDDLTRLEYSLIEWRDLEKRSGKNLLLRTGLINLGPGNDEYLAKYSKIMHQAGRVAKWMDAGEIKKRWPMLSYPTEWGAMYDPNGTVLLAHKCLMTVQDEFRQLGGTIIEARVDTIDDVEDGVLVHCKMTVSQELRVHKFKRVVVCAGPWTGKLLPELEHILSTVSIPVTYWREIDIPTGKYHAQSGFPVIFNSRLTNVYAIPSLEYPGLVKILSHKGISADPDARNLANLQGVIDHVSEYVGKYLPGLDNKKPAILEECMYTYTTDHWPIMDRCPGRPNVVVGCGYSGSGFKHSPASGLILAPLAQGKENELSSGLQLSSYRVDRFISKL